jgi:hypothetical protein
MYGVPVQGASGDQPGFKVYHILTSGSFLVCLWFAFSFEMYCTKTYWMSDHYTKIPLETLLLHIPLTISMATSFTLIVWYFYSKNNEFKHSLTRLVPHFNFMPNGQQINVGPTRNDWKYCNIFFLMGILSVVFVLYCSFQLDVFFDFTGLHKFTANIHGWRRIVYYTSIGLIYTGFIGVVVACCIFFVCCRDIVRHVEFTETLIITQAKKFLMARHYHECLLRYTDDVMNSMKKWFVIHSFFFFFIILSVAVEWVMAFSEIKHKHEDIIRILIAQAAGSFLIAFKFAFPFLAASRVTARYDAMYRRINRQWRPDVLSEVDVFMSYSIRCEAGFTLFGIKLTAQLALISLLSCFLGIFKMYKKVA